MINLVLVHGAWHGAWCWDKLIPYLTDSYKLNVIIPDYSQIINTTTGSFIDDYVDIVLNTMLVQKKSEQFVLVGHSLGGIIITSLWQKIINGIKNSAKGNFTHFTIQQLIYISGFIPNFGMSLSDCARDDVTTDMAACFNFIDKGIELKTDRVAEYLYNTCKPADISFALPKLGKQPIAVFNEKIFYDSTMLLKQNLIYVACTQDKAISFAYQKHMQSQVGAKLIALESCHSPFLSMPQNLADILIFHTDALFKI